MRSHKAVRGICLTALTTLLMAAVEGCKADAGSSAGFVDNTTMKNDPSLPFHSVWRKPGLDIHRYTKLYVTEVNTSYMLSMTGWEKGERQEIKQDLPKLAQYTRDAIQKAFREDPNHRYIVLDASDHQPGTIVFEFAITEVVPSKVALNALGYAPFGIGLAITAVRSIARDTSTVAFEARGRDGTTNKIIFTAADREAQQTTVVDVRAFTWYSEAYGIIDDWAKQFVAVANRKPGEVIEDTSAFRLQPW